MMGYGMMGGFGGFGGYHGMFGLAWLFQIVAFIVVVALIVYAIRAFTRGRSNPMYHAPSSDVNRYGSALQILAERFARGEISEEEFTRMKDSLK